MTGDNAQIGNLAGQLGAAYQVAITPGMENYPVYHTAAVFLLDPRALYHAVFTPPHDAETISKRFKVVRELEAGNPKRTLRAGDPVVINLEFRGGLVLPVAFQVRK